MGLGGYQLGIYVPLKATFSSFEKIIKPFHTVTVYSTMHILK